MMVALAISSIIPQKNFSQIPKTDSFEQIDDKNESKKSPEELYNDLCKLSQKARKYLDENYEFGGEESSHGPKMTVQEFLLFYDLFISPMEKTMVKLMNTDLAERIEEYIEVYYDGDFDDEIYVHIDSWPNPFSSEVSQKIIEHELQSGTLSKDKLVYSAVIETPVYYPLDKQQNETEKKDSKEVKTYTRIMTPREKGFHRFQSEDGSWVVKAIIVSNVIKKTKQDRITYADRYEYVYEETRETYTGDYIPEE